VLDPRIESHRKRLHFSVKPPEYAALGRHGLSIFTAVSRLTQPSIRCGMSISFHPEWYLMAVVGVAVSSVQADSQSKMDGLVCLAPCYNHQMNWTKSVIVTEPETLSLLSLLAKDCTWSYDTRPKQDSENVVKGHSGQYNELAIICTCHVIYIYAIHFRWLN